jgi:hypothetical protein
MRKLCRLANDRRGDAMIVFTIMLILIFGILVINFTGVVQTTAMRQKIYNAVQDGLTIARAKALKMQRGKTVLDETEAKKQVVKSLTSNNLPVKDLDVWYSNNRIYAGGKVIVNHLGVDTSTTETIPFEYSIEAHRNFR